MSQHISGDIGQSVRQDYGDFIQVGHVRVRKDLIKSYALASMINDAENKPYGIRLVVDHDIVGIGIGSKEETLIEVHRLDWIFKKETK